MSGNSRSKTLRFLTLAAAFVVSGLGYSGLAENPPKKAADVWVVPGRAARKKNPVAADEKSITKGKELFTMACMPCHGTSGRGDGPAAGALERDGVPIHPGDLTNPMMHEHTDGALFWKISEGRTPMPAFQEAFSEEQRWQIINYVRTLAPRPGTDKQPAKTGAEK